MCLRETFGLQTLDIEKFFYTKKVASKIKLPKTNQVSKSKSRLLQEEGNCGMFRETFCIINKLGQTEDK